LELTRSYLFYVFFSGFDHVDKQQRIYRLLSDSRTSKGSTIKEANVCCSISHHRPEVDPPLAHRRGEAAGAGLHTLTQICCCGGAVCAWSPPAVSGGGSVGGAIAEVANYGGVWGLRARETGRFLYVCAVEGSMNSAVVIAKWNEIYLPKLALPNTNHPWDK
jgi:hypothetical protein